MTRRGIPSVDYALDQYGDYGPTDGPTPDECMDDPGDLRHPYWGRPAEYDPAPGDPWTDPATITAAITRTRRYSR